MSLWQFRTKECRGAGTQDEAEGKNAAAELQVAVEVQAAPTTPTLIVISMENEQGRKRRAAMGFEFHHITGVEGNILFFMRC